MGPATEKIRLATFDCYGTLIDWEGAGCRTLRGERQQPRVDAAVLSALSHLP